MAPRNGQALKGRNNDSNGGAWVCALPGSAPSGHGFAWPIGDLALGGSAPSRIGSVWPIGDFVRGGSAPSGLGLSGGTIPPRVAPWAVSLRPRWGFEPGEPILPRPNGALCDSPGQRPISANLFALTSGVGRVWSQDGNDRRVRRGLGSPTYLLSDRLEESGPHQRGLEGASIGQI